MTSTQILLETAFGSFINIAIMLLALANCFFLYKAYQNIGQLKKELFEGESMLEKFIKKRLGQEADVDQQIRGNFAQLEEMYNNATKWYHIFTNVISVFPLLGITGTIWGIIPTVLDFSQVNSNFSLALVSTLLGVVFAVIFKFFEGFLSGSFSLVSERIAVLTGDVTKFILEKEQKQR